MKYGFLTRDTEWHCFNDSVAAHDTQCCVRVEFILWCRSSNDLICSKSFRRKNCVMICKVWSWCLVLLIDLTNLIVGEVVMRFLWWSSSWIFERNQPRHDEQSLLSLAMNTKCVKGETRSRTDVDWKQKSIESLCPEEGASSSSQIDEEKPVPTFVPSPFVGWSHSVKQDYLLYVSTQ